MQTQNTPERVTLSDVVAIVSRLSRDEREAAAVINHMLVSEQICFTKPLKADVKHLLS